MPTAVGFPLFAIGVTLAVGQLWLLWLLVRGFLCLSKNPFKAVWQLIGGSAWAAFVLLASYKLAFVLLDNLPGIDFVWLCHPNERHIFPAEFLISLFLGFGLYRLLSRFEVTLQSRILYAIVYFLRIVFVLSLLLIVLLLPPFMLPETIYDLCGRSG